MTKLEMIELMLAGKRPPEDYDQELGAGMSLPDKGDRPTVAPTVEVPMMPDRRLGYMIVNPKGERALKSPKTDMDVIHLQMMMEKYPELKKKGYDLKVVPRSGVEQGEIDKLMQQYLKELAR